MYQIEDDVAYNIDLAMWMMNYRPKSCYVFLCFFAVGIDISFRIDFVVCVIW